jgi:uncharacterized membrane protein
MTWQAMIDTTSPEIIIIEIVAMQFILPAVITLAVSEFMRKKNWIKDGDMLLRL